MVANESMTNSGCDGGTENPVRPSLSGHDEGNVLHADNMSGMSSSSTSRDTTFAPFNDDDEYDSATTTTIGTTTGHGGDYDDDTVTTVSTTSKQSVHTNLRRSFARMKSIKSAPAIQALRRRRRSNESQESVPSSIETPSYEFLLKDNKKKMDVQAADKWWRFVFVFSIISTTACILSLWLKYPYGARMSSEEVAATPWSNGCNGLESCICPRVSKRM